VCRGEATLTALEANASTMNAVGLKGTPGVIFKDKASKVRPLDGMPRLSDFPGMTGLPQQRQDDPEFERFR
jgi:thiol:disulfide interchange protein DsbG